MTEEEQLVVDADWLAGRLADVRVVDVREPWEYDGIGHVPGAVNVPFDSFRSPGEEDAGMLPGREQFATLLGDAGIAPEDSIVAYDDEHGVFASRFVVTALVYAHDDVRLLDGDYTAWSRRHETEIETPAVEPVRYDAATRADAPLIDADAVLDAIDDPEAVLVDTRTREEYASGHIRGAVQLDWRDLVDPDTRGFKPAQELLDLLAERGITPDRRVVLYCNTARRISHTYVALRHLGFGTVDFYEGSLTDWSDRGLELVEG